MPSSSTTIISKCKVFPHQKSPITTLKLSVSDLPMLSCHYIQKGVLLPSPPLPFHLLIPSLQHSLSLTLSHFPPFAGRFETDLDTGHVHVITDDSGVDFVAAAAKHLKIDQIYHPTLTDVPNCFKEFFQYDNTISFSGHHLPLAAVQVTDLSDGVFIGITVNHSLVDGTSFWHFFNTFAEISAGAGKISNSPDFSRATVFNSPAVLKVPAGGPKLTFDADQPLRERIFHFTRESIQKLKLQANGGGCGGDGGARTNQPDSTEVMGKKINDVWKSVNGVTNGVSHNGGAANGVTNGVNGNREISSFQSLSAQLWRSVTRARKLEGSKTTTFRMAVNCRHRLRPRMEPFYFGNAIQSIPTVAEAGEILSKDLCWCANLLHQNVVAHDDAMVRLGVEDWERSPRLFPLGNFDGAMITMGSSPRFPMYENDFGWGRPLAVRSGKANKFDGKISAFPGRRGNGSVDLEVVLKPETMEGLENDIEFMQYVSPIV